MRNIKNGTTEAAITHCLDQTPGDAQRDWLAAGTNQASIDANLNTVTEEQLNALEEYAAAGDATAKGLARIQVNVAGTNANLFNKVLARARVVVSARVTGNRVDRN